MDTLRIVLIVGGIALIVGIYLWDRIKARMPREEDSWQETELDDDSMDEERIDPLISNDNPFNDNWQGEAIQARREPSDDDAIDGLKGIISTDYEDPLAEKSSEGSEEAGQQEEEVIVLSLIAEEGARYNGMQILSAMELCGLEHGEMGIFHYSDLDSERTLFSVANVVEPGSFDLSTMGEMETPGLALFMRLPAPVDGEQALLTFVQQAKRLREQLSGKLTDGQRRELTRETLDDLKNTARRFRVTAE